MASKSSFLLGFAYIGSALRFFHTRFLYCLDLLLSLLLPPHITSTAHIEKRCLHRRLLRSSPCLLCCE